MDKFQERAIGNLRTRHEDAIRAAADRIRECAEYILRDLEQGRTSHYADDVLAAAQAIVIRSAALDAVNDAAMIVEAEG